MAQTAAELGYPTDAQVDGIDGINSVPAAFQRTAHRFADAIAYRTVDDRIRWTWGEVREQVRTWASALHQAGVRRHHTVGMLMTNRPEHLVTDLAASHLGAVSTSIYNTMPAVEMAYVVADAGIDVLVTQRSLVGTVRDAVIRHGLSLDHVVVFDSPAEDLPAIPGVAVSTPEDFTRAGRDDGFDFEASWAAIGREDICHIIYTSGTTGTPKGVELSHRSALAGAEVYHVVAPVAPGRRLLSAFPLAHAAERAVTYYLPVVQGHCVTFCDDVRQLSHHYLEVRPAYVFLTPRSLERFKGMIERTVALEEDPARRRAMREAVDLGIEVFTAEQTGTQVSADVRARWRAGESIRRDLLAAVGLDGVEYAGVGSAPVTLELMAFFHGLGLRAREGYGLSESGGTTALGRLDQPYRVGFAGCASPGMEISLAQDGEVLVRGTGLMTRYRNKPAETAAAIDEHGWLHSGDIGVMNELGQLRMVDRKKELIINSNGKNMSPVKIESKVKNTGLLIGQVIAVGDARPYVTALITLDPEGLEVFQKDHDIPADTPLDRLANNPDLRAALQDQIDRANADLSDAERIRAWALLTEEWPVGGDELTPTMKLRRRSITTKYADHIDGLYR
ncbi:AMP-dependent synthetase/ligase [Williamsia sp. SKLECPSW1]